MNGLTAALQAAQEGPSPVTTLSVLAAPRSTGWQRGGDPWQRVEAFPAGLAGWNGQSIAHDAAAGTSGVLRVFLSWLQGALASQYCPGGDSADPAAWTAPALTTVTTFTAAAGIFTPKPALLHENGRWHCFYALPDGNIDHRSSTNNGATWSAATAVYGGGDATGDLFASYLSATNLHVLQFATLGDVWRQRGASRLGHTGAWDLWPLHGSSAGWMPAGMVAVDGLTLRQIVWARSGSPPQHRLGSLACTLNAGGTLATRAAEAETLWLVSGEGAIKPFFHAVGAGLGGWLHSCHEDGRDHKYLCAGALNPATARIEEPAPLDTVELPLLPLERQVVPVQRDGETLLVGLGRVHRTLERVVEVSAAEEQLIAYRYRATRDGAGTLSLVVAPGTPLAAVEPGYGLWLTRSMSQGAQSGSVSLGVRILRVERRAAWVRLWGVDALGLLAQTVARRPVQFDGSVFTLQQAVQTLAEWAGVPVEWEVSLGAPAPAFQWHGGERALAALRRLLAGQDVVLRARVTVAGEAPALVISQPASVAGYAYGPAAHPLIERVLDEDLRQPRLAVAHGLAIRNDPGNGEEWTLRLATGASPGVRPMPVYMLNRNWGASELPALADASAAALARGLSGGFLESRPNLALEPNDLITVEGEDAHVVAVEERWERRRFIQRVELARA